MIVDITSFGSGAMSLLRCFSMPSNRNYFVTEAGIALQLQKDEDNEQSTINAYRFIVYQNKKIHTLFSIFSSQSQKKFVSDHIKFAALTVTDAKDINNNLLLTVDLNSPNIDSVPVLISINFNMSTNEIEVLSISAESVEMDEKQLHQLPLVLSLILPN